MTDDDAVPAESGSPAAVPTAVRAGILALVALGGISFLLSIPSIIDAGGVRCSLARTLIEDANDDDKDFNDVDTGGEEVDDLSCDDAIRMADGIRRDEDGDETRSIPDEGSIRARGAIGALISLGQALAGFLTLRSFDRRARNAALVFTALGVVLPVLGLISILVLGFAFYALWFSPTARELWPRVRRGAPPS